ncbi:MAG: glycogen synthase, partial [Oscillospiraceae bacterium]|nr:glycogen synthase [Oscillospiraceae bacterium]
MKILFATSECAPFSKSGGLADVAYSLPPALKSAGDEVAVITPLYRCVREQFGDELHKDGNCTVYLGQTSYTCGLYHTLSCGVKVWFVEYDWFFDRDRLYGYGDDALRFAFFSRAVVDLLPRPEFRPDVLHCNDWETAAAVIYLKNDQTWRADLRGVKTVYTIHNIAYQGQFSAYELEHTFALPGGWYQGGLGYEYEGRHDINLMKGAMLMADAVSTVSATYARELHQSAFGLGLEGVVDLVDRKLYGILNGIDMALYDPATDPRIPANFSRADRKGKAVCKAFVQEKFGISVEPEWPLLCSVARLVEQKGVELIRECLPELMRMGVQLIIFGQGEQQYIDYFNWARSQWPEQLGFSCDYTEQTAAELFAGADMYLMPSRFEPCGLSQMMAMRYGTVPIVHETGGLKDSVRPYSEFDGIGDGFSFASYQ